MLGKLLKHEFRATGRIMLPVMGILVLLALMFNLSIRYWDRVNSGILRVMFGLVIVAFVAGMIAICVISLVLMINRFYKNLLGEEGYLMFTLPATVHELVWSKLIVSFVWFFVTGLLILAIGLGTSISLANVSFVELFRDFPGWDEIWRALAEVDIYPSDLILAGLEYLLIIIVAGLATCLHFYAAMALGHSFSDHKVLLSVLFFVGINMAFSIISGILGITTVELAADGMIYYSINSAADSLRAFQTTMLALLGLELAQGAVLYVVTTLSLKKRLNLA